MINILKELFWLLNEDFTKLIDVLLVIYYDSHLAESDKRNRLNIKSYKNAQNLKINVFEVIYNDLIKDLNLNFIDKYLGLNESQELAIIENFLKFDEINWEELLDDAKSLSHSHFLLEYYSNPVVSNLVAKCVETIVQNDDRYKKLENNTITITDPACGTGRFLVDIHNTIKHQKTMVKGFEINQNIAKLANLVLLLAEIPNFEILFINTIKYYSEEDLLESSDITIIDPPFGTRNSTSNPIYNNYNLSYYFDGNRKKSILNILDIFIEIGIKITYPGKYVFLHVPNGFLFNTKYRDARKFILDSCILRAVISLPSESSPIAKIKTAILILQKKDQELIPKEVFMGELENFTQVQEIVEKFEKWFVSEIK